MLRAGRGYPLHWLSTSQNAPVIDKYALLKDFTQWTLASLPVLYFAWLWIWRPEPDPA
jgi:hypothetical protein